MDLAQGLRGAPWSRLSIVLSNVPLECPTVGGDAGHGSGPEPTGSSMVVAVHRLAQSAQVFPSCPRAHKFAQVCPRVPKSCPKVLEGRRGRRSWIWPRAFGELHGRGCPPSCPKFPYSAPGTEGTPAMDLTQSLRGASWSWLSTVLPKVPKRAQVTQERSRSPKCALECPSTGSSDLLSQ